MQPRRALLDQHHVKPQSLAGPAKPHSGIEAPAVLEPAVDEARAAKWYGQSPWRTRSRQYHGVIKVGLSVAFEAHEVRIQRNRVLAQAGLAREAIRPGCSQHLLSLLGNGLG